MSDASKRKEKQKWVIEKPKLDNARESRGIYFIDLDDEEFKRFMKNARRKLEIPIPAAMPCKTPMCQSSRETCRIVEAEECMRIRMERGPHRYHEDHIAGKVMNSPSHYNLMHKFIPIPQAVKLPDARAAVEKE